MESVATLISVVLIHIDARLNGGPTTSLLNVNATSGLTPGSRTYCRTFCRRWTLVVFKTSIKFEQIPERKAPRFLIADGDE